MSKIRTIIGLFKLVPAVLRGVWYAHKYGDEVEDVVDDMIACYDCIVQGRFLPCESHEQELDEIMEKIQ